MSTLAHARYGKDNVRILKIVRDPSNPKHQTVYEYTVKCLLEGDVEESYTKANNAPVVATDSIKNTIYILGKQNDVYPPEQFAATIGNHFVSTYRHIHSAHVDISEVRWSRMIVDGKEHEHSFVNDKSKSRKIHLDFYENGKILITSTLGDLTVLKSTGSAFTGFYRDEYTTLAETDDRILSTDISASYTFKPFNSVDEIKSKNYIFDKAYNNLLQNTLHIFATDNSPSVQATMYDIGTKTLADIKELESVTISLPNKHYVEAKLDWFKSTKNSGKDAEIFVPLSSPNGLIKCTVGRNKSKL